MCQIQIAGEALPLVLEYGRREGLPKRSTSIRLSLWDVSQVVCSQAM
jgi:hypothetical protein